MTAASAPTEHPQDFAGLTALVTGGASGIGAATAALLTARGARVAVLDRDPSGAPEGTVAGHRRRHLRRRRYGRPSARP